MKKTILLIDDSRTQLSSLKLFLTKAGYEVTTARDGLEGIQIAYEIMPDLIVSDILMPNMNGYQLCRLLKNSEYTNHIPIILLTVLDKKLDKFWGIRAGADAFVKKDASINNLIQEVNRLIEKVKILTDEEKKDLLNKAKFSETVIQSQLNEILDKTLIESTIMNEFRNLSEFILDIDVLNARIFSILDSIIDYNLAGIFFNSRDDKKEKILFYSICGFKISEETLLDLNDDFFSKAYFDINTNDLKNDTFKYEIVEKNIEKNITIENKNQFKSNIIIPIKSDNNLIGGLCLYSIDEEKFQAVETIFNIVLNELKLLMRLKWLYSETKFLAVTDVLTGLYNRRYFQEILEREFSRSKRYCSSLSLAIIDIDYFKQVNDIYGHQFGDQVLIKISDLIMKSLRKTDYVARYGGEEFIAILPETDLQNALIPFERLRQTIETTNFKYKNTLINVTISIGIAAISSRITSDDQLIQYADEALYRAKANGRNRIEVSEVEIYEK